MAQRRVVEVFTNKSKDLMLAYGGSASWVMSVGRADSIIYCVCCRNPEIARDEDTGERGEARNEAFFVGKVSDIVFVERQNERDRYFIKFSEYAEVSVPNFRAGSLRNPVLYSDVDACRVRGLDIDALDFKPMPEPTRFYDGDTSRPPAVSGVSDIRPLSIAEAKAGLALKHDVPVSSIQIIITG